jgi:hypothetical protein
MANNKYNYLSVLQGNYGYGHGFEDLCQGTRAEMRADLKSYRENAPEYSYRIINRRELIRREKYQVAQQCSVSGYCAFSGALWDTSYPPTKTRAEMVALLEADGIIVIPFFFLNYADGITRFDSDIGVSGSDPNSADITRARFAKLYPDAEFEILENGYNLEGNDNG